MKALTTIPQRAPQAPRPDAIPPHVWNLLQEAGEEAAERLLALLQSPRFPSYRASDQKALIELALTRAYGLPIKREVSVNLSSSDSDAVAASIAALGDALVLPERKRSETAKNGPYKPNSEKSDPP